MNAKRTFHGLLLLVALASVGVVLVYLPGYLLAQYRAVAGLGRPWLVYAYFGVVGAGGVILVGCTIAILWRLGRSTRRKRQRRDRRAKSPSQLTCQQKQQEIDENLEAIEELKADPAAAEWGDELDPLTKMLEAKRQAQTLEIVAFGTISSGKSSLLNALAGRDLFQTDAKGGTTLYRNQIPWPGMDRVILVDTPGLGEADGAERTAIAADAAKDADLVLLTVDGPLRQSESALLERLRQMEKRVIVCLNKEDWYEPDDRDRLLSQIRDQLGGLVADVDVVAVRAKPALRRRVRCGADGSQQEEDVEVAADIAPLADRMVQVVRAEGSELLLANLLLRSRGLVHEARQRVRRALDRRARDTVHRYMWGAAGAAAVSPLPLVDLAAGCAISSKMVLELAAIYRQPIDLEAAVALLRELGKNLVSVAGLSVATPAIAAAVASLLKTVPGAGTLAGGLLQGVVQALVTRWIGAVFIAYFRDEMQQPEGGLAGLAQREWQRLTTVDELRKLVKLARQHHSSEDDTSLP